MNSVVLTGRIATDIEKRTTQSGVSTCSFRIAVQRRFKNANGVYEADFIQCVAWRSTADFISKFFIKGNPITVSGSWQVRSYQAQDGSKRTMNECVLESAEFAIGGKQDGSAKPADAPAQFTEVEDEDLPF